MTAADSLDESRRGLRADAQMNRDRVLEAATAAFKREGGDASMRTIAKEAGVGVGTLYRRFPTRDLLVQAVYEGEIRHLSEAAPILLESHAPVDALREWMQRFVEFMDTKRELGAALKAILKDEQDRLRTRALLAEALETLLVAGHGAGSLRGDVAAPDVLLGLGGIVLIAGEEQDHALSDRLLELLLDGLRP